MPASACPRALCLSASAFANDPAQSFALRSPFALVLAAHVQGLPVDELEYVGLADLSPGIAKEPRRVVVHAPSLLSLVTAGPVLVHPPSRALPLATLVAVRLQTPSFRSGAK